MSDQTIRDYDDVSIKIRCEGTPKPSVKWHKDGKEIVESDRFKIKTTCEGQVDSELVITHFNAEDAGKVIFKSLFFHRLYNIQIDYSINIFLIILSTL